MIWATVLALLPAAPAQDAKPRSPIDIENSTLTVRVFKSGLLSAFGHEHEIRAPIEQGFFSLDPPSAELTVDARKLRVLDPGVSEHDRSEIQNTMLGPKVLDSDAFPEIQFQSSSAIRQTGNKWLVSGNLTLHGQTRPVQLVLEAKDGHYRGQSVLKQTDFAITPVVVAGGAVRVKNEIRVEFDVVGK